MIYMQGAHSALLTSGLPMHGGKNDVVHISSKRQKYVGMTVSISKCVKPLFWPDSSNITMVGLYGLVL